MEKSRKAAKAKGEHRYHTGKPCCKGHIADRFTANGNCIVCRQDFEDKHWPDGNPYHKTDEWKAYQKEYQRKYKLTDKGKAAKYRAYVKWNTKRLAEYQAKKNET